MRYHTRLLASWFLLALAFSSTALGQGTYTWFVRFYGVSDGESIGMTRYEENNMLFTPINGAGQFGLSGNGRAAGFPSNGTVYAVAGYGDSLSVVSPYGRRFGMVSVDLSEFGTLYSYPWTVHFIGYKPDGSSVSTDFITDGIIDGAGPLADFERFYFDDRFADLVRLDIPGYGWSLDNLQFKNVVPEPTSGVLFLLGTALLMAPRRRTPARVNPTRSVRGSRARPGIGVAV